MQNYKEVCGDKKYVWFEVSPSEGKKFLKWAKDLGCAWSNGEEVKPENGADFFHFSIRSDGTLAYVDMIAWFSKHPKFESADRYVFSEYIKGKKVKPSSYLLLFRKQIN